MSITVNDLERTVNSGLTTALKKSEINCKGSSALASVEPKGLSNLKFILSVIYLPHKMLLQNPLELMILFLVFVPFSF